MLTWVTMLVAFIYINLASTKITWGTFILAIWLLSLLLQLIPYKPRSLLPLVAFWVLLGANYFVFQKFYNSASWRELFGVPSQLVNIFV